MAKIPLYNGKGFAIVDDEDFVKVKEYRWTLSTLGYVTRNDGKGGSVYLHRDIMNLEKGDGKYVDHINHDKLDNRKTNLRVCTKQENQLNQGPKKRKDGTSHSKYKGVSRRSSKSVRPWRCRIAKDGKTITKYFETEIEAAKEYDRLALELHGEYAYINGIKDNEEDIS